MYLSLFNLSVLNKENCTKVFSLSVLSNSLTPKMLKSGLKFSLNWILTSVVPSPGIKLEI